LWLRQVEIQLRALAPFITGLFAVLLDLVPWPGLGPLRLSPFSTLCVVYFWSIYRPDLFTASAAFLIGLAYDALAGLPLGLSSLALLLMRHLVVSQQRFFLARSFPVVWFCLALLAPAVIGVRWLLGCLWWGHWFALAPPMLELGLSLALYPPIAWLLGRIHNQIPRVIHAS
jgi:rod shape-determining protein MreD